MAGRDLARSSQAQAILPAPLSPVCWRPPATPKGYLVSAVGAVRTGVIPAARLWPSLEGAAPMTGGRLAPFNRHWWGIEKTLPSESPLGIPQSAAVEIVRT